MIAALRGAVYEAIKREEENVKMFKRLAGECKDPTLCNFIDSVAKDAEQDIHRLKHLNLHSIIKYGLAIKFEAPKIEIDNTLVGSITDKAGAREILKVAIDQIGVNIEYFEHIADHSIFPEVKRLFRVIADKELEDKSRLKALYDMLE